MVEPCCKPRGLTAQLRALTLSHQWYLPFLAFGGMEIPFIETENARKRSKFRGKDEFPLRCVSLGCFRKVKCSGMEKGV